MTDLDLLDLRRRFYFCCEFIHFFFLPFLLYFVWHFFLFILSDSSDSFLLFLFFLVLVSFLLFSLFHLVCHFISDILNFFSEFIIFFSTGHQRKQLNNFGFEMCIPKKKKRHEVTESRKREKSILRKLQCEDFQILNRRSNSGCNEKPNPTKTYFLQVRWALYVDTEIK